MAIPKLNFNTGNVVDPTRGAIQGLESARGVLTDMMKQGLAQEELAKQEARQKMLDDRQKLIDDRQEARQVVLDDRASEEYNYKLTERAKAEAEAKQKQSYLNALSSPGDMFESKAVQEKLMSPGAMAQMVANNPVLVKANEQGIESLTPQEKVQYENHFKQMDRLGAMPTKKMEILDAADLYGVLGGEYATTQAVEAKKALELARNTGLADVNKQRTEMSIAQLKDARRDAQKDSRGSEHTGSKNEFGVKVVSPIDVMKDAQSYHEKVYAEDGKGGKLAKPINTLTQLMANNGYDAAQISAVVDEGYKPSTKWSFRSRGKDAELKTPTMSELNSLVGAPRNVATSTGYSVSDRTYDKQVAEISKKYLDEAQSKIENRGVHKPTEELFNRIMNNTYGNASETAAKKPLSREIEKPVKVSEAISAKREEKLLPKPVYSKDTVNTYAADMQAYDEQQKRLGLAPTGANDSKTKVVTPTIDTKKIPTMQSTIEQIVDKDPSSGILNSGARVIAGAFGDQSLGNRRVGDKSALNIFDALAQEGVVSRVTSNKDPVEVTSNNIANITELYTNGKDRNIDRGLETVVDHQMRSLPKDNELRVKYEEAMEDQELASAGAVAISTVLLATGMGGEVGAASLRGTARAKKLADTKNLRSWKNELKAQKRARDSLEAGLNRNAVLRSRNPEQLNISPKPLLRYP